MYNSQNIGIEVFSPHLSFSFTLFFEMRAKNATGNVIISSQTPHPKPCINEGCLRSCGLLYLLFPVSGAEVS